MVARVVIGKCLIKQFDFIIASRYHSIVHAYKHGVPVIAIGWAVKYSDLLASFNQAQYCFDVTRSLNTDEIFNKLDNLLHDYQHEREGIVNKLKTVQTANVFDIFDDDTRFHF